MESEPESLRRANITGKRFALLCLGLGLVLLAVLWPTTPPEQSMQAAATTDPDTTAPAPAPSPAGADTQAQTPPSGPRNPPMTQQSVRVRLALSAQGGVEVIAAEPSTWAPLRQRNARLAPEHLLIVGYIAGNERWRISVPDPRVRRAESFHTDGSVDHHAHITRETSQLTLFVPREPAIDEVVIQQPQWNGTTYDLKALASIPL